jgi:Fe-S-cluster containining protein
VVCRPHCAACCIEVSISSPIPGMPGGKPAGIPCIQLDEALRCRLFGRPERPAVCSSLAPTREMCGADASEAYATLRQLEADTAPAAGTTSRSSQRE